MKREWITGVAVAAGAAAVYGRPGYRPFRAAAPAGIRSPSAHTGTRARVSPGQFVGRGCVV